MDKAELFRRINAARGRLDAAIARVPESQMNVVAIYNLWTVKDLLAHITVWERYALDIHGALSNGRQPQYHFNTVPVDDVNAETLAANKDRPLADIRADYVETHGDLLQMIEDAPDALLFDGDYWPYTQGYAFEEWIASNSYEHYDEHLPDVIGFLAQIEA